MTQTIQEQIIFGKDVELITITDLDGVITYTNDAYHKDLGYQSNDLIGIKAAELDHLDMPKSAASNFKSKKKHRKSWTAAVKKQHLNGGYYWVKEVVTPIYENASVVAYQSVCTALTSIEQDNAESLYAELKENNSILYSWENFYKRFLTYALVSASIFALGLYTSFLFSLFFLMPFIIYYCELKKSSTLFETVTGDFEDVTRCIFNKKTVSFQEESTDSSRLTTSATCQCFW